ncbi:hypothetical protein HRbin22_01830 [Candidatus Thermoflexus japonica]|uniref:Uncharacterized protein n=1 Tax=Candidatus Thermoflexus japonica TaxID=2035417 RepID=A0A2H5Y845_9CHLR|nr:hypothetical protein HRbin22_01830 [Candidatus Thermoflexus japonica]
MRPISERLSRVPSLLVLLAHGLAVLSLLAFRLRADGWVLHPIAVFFYLTVLLSASIPWLIGPQGIERPFRLILPPLLTLALLEAWSATAWLGGARYAPYDPGEQGELALLLHRVTAALIATLAALYRWPELLRAGALAQGLLVLLNPESWAAIVRFGLPGWPAAPGVLLLPMFYGLGAVAIGFSFTRRMAPGIGLGLAAGLVMLGWSIHRGALNGATDPERLWAGGLVLLGWTLMVSLPFLAWGAKAPSGQAGRARFPWESLALFLWFPTGIAADLLTPGRGLPAAGSLQPWVDPDQVVPDAWLPTLFWASGILAGIHRWAPLLLLPAIIDGFRWIRAARTTGLFRPSPIRAALLGGFALLWMASPPGWMAAPWIQTPPGGFGLLGPMMDMLLLFQLALVGIAGWILIARGLEREAWGGWRWLGRSALFLFGALWLIPAAEMMQIWLRSLIFPGSPPPLAAALSMGIGSLLYGAAVGAGLAALIQSGKEWVAYEISRGITASRAFLRAVVTPALPFLFLTVLGWWVTRPTIIRTIPPAGARAVSPDTIIRVEMGPSRVRQWFPSLGWGGGIEVRYADTGEPIPGNWGGWEEGFYFDPEVPLRPGATIEVTVFRWGEQPYRFQFTVGEFEPRPPTPLPWPTGLPSPIPTPTAMPPGRGDG